MTPEEIRKKMREGASKLDGFFSDNPVDACVDAIKALHELNLL